MILRAFFAVLIFACLCFLSTARADYEGQCGGAYRGQDGGTYACGPNRKPYCQQDTGRCQCLERRSCPGGKKDEEW